MGGYLLHHPLPVSEVGSRLDWLTRPPPHIKLKDLTEQTWRLQHVYCTAINTGNDICKGKNIFITPSRCSVSE